MLAGVKPGEIRGRQDQADASLRESGGDGAERRAVCFRSPIPRKRRSAVFAARYRKLRRRGAAFYPFAPRPRLKDVNRVAPGVLPPRRQDRLFRHRDRVAGRTGIPAAKRLARRGDKAALGEQVLLSRVDQNALPLPRPSVCLKADGVTGGGHTDRLLRLRRYAALRIEDLMAESESRSAPVGKNATPALTTATAPLL